MFWGHFWHSVYCVRYVYILFCEDVSVTFQGCMKGRHNPVKPAEPVKPKVEPLAPGKVSVQLYVLHVPVGRIVTLQSHSESCVCKQRPLNDL